MIKPKSYLKRKKQEDVVNSIKIIKEYHSVAGLLWTMFCISIYLLFEANNRLRQCQKSLPQ